MGVFVIIFSLFIACIGWLVKSQPDLIAGYNTMSAEKKKNVDIAAAANLLCKGLLMIAASTIALYVIFRWLLDIPAVAQGVWIVPIFIGTPVLLVMARKYDKNPRSGLKYYLTAGLAGVLFAAIAIMLMTGVQPTKAIVEGEGDAREVRLTGQYGVRIPLKDIARCELLEEIPAIVARVHGMSIGDIRKGQFRLAGEGKCRLLLMKRSEAPYLFIETKTGEKIIFNSPDPTLTEGLFEVIQP